MAICIKRFWVIFGQFWLFRAHFGPRVSKMYLLQLFRCKENNEINKSGAISLFGKLDSPCAPKPTLGPKSPLKRPRRAKIGLNAPLVVQLIGFGPKKTNLSRSVLRCVPFTRNQPVRGLYCIWGPNILPPRRPPSCLRGPPLCPPLSSLPPAISRKLTASLATRKFY